MKSKRLDEATKRLHIGKEQKDKRLSPRPLQKVRMLGR